MNKSEKRLIADHDLPADTPFRAFVLVIALAAGILGSACESGASDDGLDSSNIGDNSPNTVLCMGDSITQGACRGGGVPYPDRLALLIGKTAVNEGRGGETSDSGAARIGDALNKNNPGVVIILYGANDLLQGRDSGSIQDSLRTMIRSARANRTVPVLATLTPMTGPHQTWSTAVAVMNIRIRKLADEEKITLVDLERAFGNEPGALLTDDGLHPNDLGNQVIAGAFAKAF